MRGIRRKLRWGKKGTVTIEYALLLSCLVAGSTVVWKGLGQWIKAVVEGAIQQFPSP